MLGTVAGVTAVVTAASAYRNTRQWEGYHRNDVSRTGLVNGIFMTCLLGAGTVVLFIFRNAF